MNYIFVGKIVNTHGLKGEVRIISKFKYKDEVFKKNMILYLGKRKQPMTINTYRFHKIYDMVTFDGINDINEAIAFKGDEVYVDRDSINAKYVNEDIIGCDVYNDNSLIGKVTSIMDNPHHDLLVINNKTYVPFIDEFIVNVDIDNKRIDIKVIEGLINEN